MSSRHRYSFSGADARGWVYFDGAEEGVRQLESLHTVSVSVHEAKGQARALGFRGTKGIARGVRTIGGSMIFTVIEDNPLRPIIEAFHEAIGKPGVSYGGWSVDRREVGVGTAIDQSAFINRIAPLIAPFNFLATFVSEAALFSMDDDNPRYADLEGAAYLIRGVEFIDEGIVTSVNDIVSEVTLSFVATDYKPLSPQDFGASVDIELQEETMMDRDYQLRKELFRKRQSKRRIRQEKILKLYSQGGS